jgi:DNA helicase-2/ATP-dependent DNA helicase PcrA
LSDLTPEQRDIVEAPSTTRILVRADPGTGKTFTLVARCLALAEHAERPVLVLSFTRAVVGELRRRAAEAGAPVVASTIDAYAGQVLRRAGRESAGSFDATVRLAAAIVTEEPEFVVVPNHILVDEVQDLVGPRLDFVLALLRRASEGFSLFGDPRQAIYAFESDDRDVFEVIEETFPEVENEALTVIHRGKVARLLARDRNADGPSLLRDAAAMTSVRQAALALRSSKSSTVLLTRTNGEALVMSDFLAAAGTTTTTRQGATARLPPVWLTNFASADPRTTWNRRQVQAIAESLDDAPPPAETWRVLRRIAPRDSGVGLQELRRAASEPSRFDDFASPDGRISTIHRAKGLEWDTVIVLRPEARTGETEAEEQRVVFVAATRAREELWQLSRPDFGGPLGLSRADKRWEVRAWRRRFARKFEVRIGDVVTHEPFGGAQASAVQERLRRCSAGDAVRLVLEGESYTAVTQEGPIARMTDAFSAAVATRRSALPHELTGGRVLVVRTAAGDPTQGTVHGLPDTGLWLSPEITGLVTTLEGSST